jgi:hypothetical protein
VADTRLVRFVQGKGKGLDSSFSTSPELPPPSIPKGDDGMPLYHVCRIFLFRAGGSFQLGVNLWLSSGFQMMEESDRDADVCPTCLEGYDSGKTLCFIYV